MTSLSLFPARATIGRVTLPDRTELDVLMTPEFSRALGDVFTRIGGANGLSTEEIITMLGNLAVVDSFEAPPVVVPEVLSVFSDAPAAPRPADPAVFHENAATSAEVAALRAEVDGLRREMAMLRDPPRSTSDTQALEVMLAMQDVPHQIIKGTVTGSRAANVALASLLTALARSNIVVDQSVI